MENIIIAIDPSSTAIGYAAMGNDKVGNKVVFESGTLRLEGDFETRIPELGKFFYAFTLRFKSWGIYGLAIEESILGGHGNVRSALKLANAKGAIITAICIAAELDRYINLHPLTVKTSFSGMPSADKKFMRHIYMSRIADGDIEMANLGNRKLSEHEIDAIAIGYTALSDPMLWLEHE